MPYIEQTQVAPMKVRNRRLAPMPSQETGIQWAKPVKRKRGEALLKNMAVAAALVLCAVTLRTGAIPSLSDAADVVMTAASDQSLLDDQLGKLSFVSALFPEAVLVFGESTEEALSLPVSAGAVVHAWTESEPYLSWSTSETTVVSASDGEVVGIYHGNGDERLVQVMGSDGLACLYGNLEEIAVETGDFVSAGDVLGTLMTGAEFVFEVRRDGMSIDPALFFD